MPLVSSKYFSLFIYLPVLLAVFSCKSPVPPELQADIIYHNGNLITMEEEQPSASTLAIKNGQILAVGDESLLGKHQGDSSQVVDLQGKTMTPGFVDAHSHFAMATGIIREANLFSPPVGTIQSIDDIIRRLKAHQEQRQIRPGEWIIGWGYDPDLLKEKRHPNKIDLDKAFPDNPVFLLHVSAHMSVVNSQVLNKMGFDEETPDPPGGKIVRLEGTNEPSGLLQEAPSFLVQQQLPQHDKTMIKELIGDVEQLYASYGITTAQDGFTDLEHYRILHEMTQDQELQLDVECLASFMQLEDFISEFGTDFGKATSGARLTGVKIILDGSPQGKTAYFSEPYLTEVPGCAHNCRGFPNLNPQQLNQLMTQCYGSGIQLYTHANGDGAIDLWLDTHQKVVDSLYFKEKDLRSVIIHSQFVRRDQLEAYKKHKIIPAYFSNHAFFWGDVHLQNLGEERASFLSPLKTSMDMGITCTNHTDFLVTPIDQIFLLWTAVNRQTRSGKILGSDERISPLEGLKAITINSAYQHRQENRKGSLKAGKLADLVILSDNPLTIAPENIRDIQVLETIKAGKTIFERGK